MNMEGEGGGKIRKWVEAYIEMYCCQQATDFCQNGSYFKYFPNACLSRGHLRQTTEKMGKQETKYV